MKHIISILLCASLMVCVLCFSACDKDNSLTIYGYVEVDNGNILVYVPSISNTVYLGECNGYYQDDDLAVEVKNGDILSLYFSDGCEIREIYPSTFSNSPYITILKRDIFISANGENYIAKISTNEITGTAKIGEKLTINQKAKASSEFSLYDSYSITSIDNDYVSIEIEKAALNRFMKAFLKKTEFSV